MALENYVAAAGRAAICSGRSALPLISRCRTFPLENMSNFRIRSMLSDRRRDYFRHVSTEVPSRCPMPAVALFGVQITESEGAPDPRLLGK